MTAVRLFVVALNLVAGALMGMAVHTIMGPGPIAPAREPWQDALWLAFHIGPCAMLAGLAVASRWVGSRALPFTLIAVTLAVAIPGLLVAQFEADSRPDGFAPMYGAFTFGIVCVQYVVVLVTGVGVGIGWVRRRVRSQ